MRKTNAAFIMLLIVASAHQVCAVKITGNVKDVAGIGIQGATVRLGRAGIATTTGTGGSFTLAGGSDGVSFQGNGKAANAGCSFACGNVKLFFNVAVKSAMTLAIYDLNGRRLASGSETVQPGNRAFLLPHSANGLHIYRFRLNHSEYIFENISCASGHALRSSSQISTSSARHAVSAVRIDDALLCVKAGYKLFRLPIVNPDTSGVRITMVPFDTGTLTDADGNTYKTIRYGNQVWAVENLRTMKYNDGEQIPLVTDSAAWSELKTPAGCFFNYSTDTAAQRKWGAFYNWHAVQTGKLAPPGWHVPTDADWDTLLYYLIVNGYNFDGTTIENKIAKSMAVATDWLSSTDSGATGNDSIGNNASGFSAVPNGYCDYNGETYYRNWYAFWWTATAQDTSFVKIRGISYSSGDLKSSTFTKVYGLSVRLVRDR